MKNKQNKAKAGSKKQQNQQVQAVKSRKATPFRDTGGIIGTAVGGMFGNKNFGRGVGKWLGTGIGSVFGSGDYTLAGATPSYNVLANGNQIPKFSSSSQTNIVCHREYLGDISGTTAFNINSYPLNPGSTATFPWLSSIAINYQQYKFHGLIFEFRSLLTDFVTSGTPGVVVMATNYNADDTLYTSKQEMENSEFALSVKPTLSLMHGVECADQQTFAPIKFVRDTSIVSSEDLKTYDLGNFMLATQGNPLVGLGELWVTYCVEFFKPILPDVVALDIRSGHVQRTTVIAANPLGLIQTSSLTNIGLTTSATTVQWTGIVGQKYELTVNWKGVAGIRTVPGASISNGSFIPYYADGATSQSTPAAGATDTNQCFNAFILCTAAGPLVITFNAGGVFPATQTVDITVTTLSTTI